MRRIGALLRQLFDDGYRAINSFATLRLTLPDFLTRIRNRMNIAPGSMRKQVRFFCSYASKDARLVESLLDLLLPHLKASRQHEYAIWEFHKLLAGERWHERIQDEIAQCDFGLLFLSPEFLASSYIAENEVPPLLERKGIVPVGLKPVDFTLHDLQSLDDYQLFRLRTVRGPLRWFSELRGADRDAFALELFRQIERRLA